MFDNTDISTTGKRIRVIRKGLGLTIEKFAQELGITKNHLALVEVGKRTPSLFLLHHIAQIGNIDYAWLSGENKEWDADLPDTVGARVRAVRRHIGITLDDLAKRVGVTKNHLGLVETGKRNPSDQLLQRVAEIGNVESVWLRGNPEKE